MTPAYRLICRMLYWLSSRCLSVWIDRNARLFASATRTRPDQSLHLQFAGVRERSRPGSDVFVVWKSHLHTDTARPTRHQPGSRFCTHGYQRDVRSHYKCVQWKISQWFVFIVLDIFCALLLLQCIDAADWANVRKPVAIVNIGVPLVPSL